MTQAAGGNLLRAEEKAAFLEQGIASTSREPCTTPRSLLDASGQSRAISVQSGKVKLDGQESIIKHQESTLDEKIPKQSTEATIEEKQDYLNHQFLPARENDIESQLFTEIMGVEEDLETEEAEIETVKRESIDLEEDESIESSETVGDVDDLAAAFFGFGEELIEAKAEIITQTQIEERSKESEALGQEEKAVGHEEKTVGHEEKTVGHEEKTVGQAKVATGQKEGIVSDKLKVESVKTFSQANVSGETMGCPIKNADGTYSFKSVNNMNKKEHADVFKLGIACRDTAAKKLFVGEGNELSSSKTVTFTEVDENGKEKLETYDVEVVSKEDFVWLTNFVTDFINDLHSAEKTEIATTVAFHGDTKPKDQQQTFTLFFAEREVADKTYKAFSKLTQQRESASAKLTKEEESSYEVENKKKKQDAAIDKARTIVKVQEEKREIAKEQVNRDEQKREICVLESKRTLATHVASK